MQEKILLNATLCFPVQNDKVLLAMKTQKIGKGCWNGYGGGIEQGETPADAALRELHEEAKVIARLEDLEKAAVMDFHNETSVGGIFVCRVHVFLVNRWEGNFQATDEMTNPTWFETNNLPLDKMMPADRVWLPLVLRGRKIIGSARYTPFQTSLIGDVAIKLVASFQESEETPPARLQ